MSPRLALLLMSAVLLSSGCEVPSELGKPCVLVKGSQSGQGSEPVTLSDLQPGQDFISFGSLDCEDLICVLDGKSERVTTNDGRVQGYCSKACVPTQANSCTITDPSVSADLRGRMACRALLLDQQALDELRRRDPARY
jgi:hypothetical protein